MFSKNLTVFQHLKFLCLIHKINLKSIDRILDYFNILSLKNNYPLNLSGGELRKFSLVN